MTQRRHLLLLAMAAALAHRATAATEQTNGEDKTLLFPSYSNSPQATRLSRVIETAYAAMGYQAMTERMPAERGMLEADHGIAAGEISRTPFIEKVSPNLIRVPVQMDVVSISTMTKAASLAAPTLEQAAHMHVGIQKGIKNVEALVEGWPSVERTMASFAMLKMLNVGNIDVIIGYTENLSYTLAQVGLSPDLFSFREVHRDPVYHYLHKRHAALVPAIAAELNKIKGKYPTVVEGFKARGDQ